MNILVALRNGMDQTVEPPGDFTPITINVLAVPSGFFLSEQQVAAARAGRSLIPTEQLQPLLLDQTDEPVADPTNKPVELERWRQRDAHFRPDFKLGDVGDIA